MAPWPQIQPELAKKTHSQNHPQNSIFCSVTGSDSCYLGYRQLYCYQMTQSIVIGAQEGVPKSQSCYLTTKWCLNFPNKCSAKITPEKACSALSGDPTAVTSVTNHPSFIRWPKVKFSELKRRFLHHKVAPWPQLRPEKATKTPSQNHPQIACFTLSGDQTAVTSVTNNSIFIKWPQAKLSGRKGGSYITKWLPDHKCCLNRKNKRPAKITPKIGHFALSGDVTAVTSVTNPCIFIKWP